MGNHDMAREKRAHLPDMSDEGDRVRERRERLGIDKKRLAAEAGISRETLAAIEDGKSFRRSTLAKIEAALTAAELEAGITAPSTSTDAGLLEFEGIVGEDRVIVRGPVTDQAQLVASLTALIQALRPDSTPPGEGSSEVGNRKVTDGENDA